MPPFWETVNEQRSRTSRQNTYRAWNAAPTDPVGGPRRLGLARMGGHGSDRLRLLRLNEERSLGDRGDVCRSRTVEGVLLGHCDGWEVGVAGPWSLQCGLYGGGCKGFRSSLLHAASHHDVCVILFPTMVINYL